MLRYSMRFPTHNINQINVIYLDFWKAFDSVPDNKLLAKLWNLRITGTLCGFIPTYTANSSVFLLTINYLI